MFAATGKELLTLYPLPQDIRAVGEWLGAEPEQLRFRMKEVSMAVFAERAKAMSETYGQFPKDGERTDKILSKLQQGLPQYPVFVEEDDDVFSIMEGRHRIVAAWLFGAEAVPVYLVRRIES